MKRADFDAWTRRELDAVEAALDAWVPAAGIPWFLSLFGRDALTVSLQTMSLSPRFALGSLRALGALVEFSRDTCKQLVVRPLHRMGL